MNIREATLGDANSIAALTGELGYVATSDAIAERLKRVLGRPGQRVRVAIVDGQVAGWAQAHATDVIESGFRVEIVGLVVSERVRGRGVGRALINDIERWAAEVKADALVVRSNVTRQESHRFYPALGYEVSKTQAVYRKRLPR